MDLAPDLNPGLTRKLNIEAQYKVQIDKRCLEELTYLILRADDIKFDVLGPRFNVKDLNREYNDLFRFAYKYAY